MVYDLRGINPVCIAKLNDCELLIELDLKKNLNGVAQKLTSWEGLNVEVTYLLSYKRQLMASIRSEISSSPTQTMLR